MHISNETQRLAHPQTRLIPKSLMMDFRYFNGELPEAFIPLMKAETETSFYASLQGFVLPNSEREGKCLWLAIALSHPNFSMIKLREQALQIGLTPLVQIELAIASGNKDYLKYLANIKEYAELLEQQLSPFFSLASQYGHVDLLRYFEEKAPTKLQEMLSYDNFKIFKGAARNGYLEILRYLGSKADPTKLQEMIASDHCFSFKWAGRNGHLEILRYIESTVTPEKLQEMIAAEDFYAFKWASERGFLAILQYLEAKAPNKIQEMIKAGNFWAFKFAVQSRRLEVTNHLLTFASVFAYAEAHQQEYGLIITPFLAKQLANLRTRKQTFELANPNAVFDVANEEESDLFFYYARQLIRRNDPSLRDELLFLLEIPGVRNRAHRSVQQGPINELLRLSLSVNNSMAAELLLAIPAVRQDAQVHNYYREEQRGGLDLRQLARDRESSMTALSQGEQQRLQQLLACYKPMLDAAGIEQCMKALRKELEQRYEAHPSTILIPAAEAGKKQVFALPLQWSAFKALNLEEPYYSNALKAYYEHKEHSAWRYLLKPNPWMHTQASYVYINEQNHKERWSTFEEYQSLISVLYLAAIDNQTQAIDGYTLETRLNHFIAELALIGRAHNWDETRIKTDAQGKVLVKDGKPIIEEYDNLEGDRPSCFSGVKRRLLQSVQGHPLLAFLTKEKLTQELNDYVRDYFKTVITNSNRQKIKAAWDKAIDGNNLLDTDWNALKLIDIPIQKQQELITKLSQKYGTQFSDDLGFKVITQQAFTLKRNPDAHLLNFGHLHLEKLLEDTPLQLPGQAGIFGVPKLNPANSALAQTTKLINSMDLR